MVDFLLLIRRLHCYLCWIFFVSRVCSLHHNFCSLFFSASFTLVFFCAVFCCFWHDIIWGDQLLCTFTKHMKMIKALGDQCCCHNGKIWTERDKNNKQSTTNLHDGSVVVLFCMKCHNQIVHAKIYRNYIISTLKKNERRPSTL